MPPPLEIPGYYFDPEKKKYFKILPSWKAPPGSTGFVTDDKVRKRKRDEAKAAKEEEVQAKPAVKSLESRLDSENICGFVRAREAGGVKQAAVQSLLASRLKKTFRFAINEATVFDVSNFDDETRRKFVLAGTSTGHLVRLDLPLASPAFSPVSYPPDTFTNPNSVFRLPFRTHIDESPARPHGPVTSLHFLNSNSFVATNLGSPLGPGQLRIFTLDGRIVKQWSPHLGSMFCSAVDGSEQRVALGLSKAVGYLSSPSEKARIIRSPSDPFSTLFRNDSLFAGLRDGRIISWDLRERSRPQFHGSHGPGGSTTGLAMIGDYHLLSTGSGGTVTLFDIRTNRAVLNYPHPEHGSPLTPLHLSYTPGARHFFVLGEHGLRVYHLWTGTQLSHTDCKAGTLTSDDETVWTMSGGSLARWDPIF